MKLIDILFKDGNNYVTLLDILYPIGATYISDNKTNPGNFLGGTWVSLGAGRYIASVGTDSNGFTIAAGKNGNKNFTLTSAQLPTHTHTYDKSATTSGSTTLTAAQSGVPAHSHGLGDHTHGMNHRHTTPKLTHSVTHTDPTVKSSGTCTSGAMSANASHSHGTPSSVHWFLTSPTTDQAGVSVDFWRSIYNGSQANPWINKVTTTASASIAHTHTIPNHTHSLNAGSCSVGDHGASYTGNSIATNSTSGRTATDKSSGNTGNNSASAASSGHTHSITLASTSTGNGAFANNAISYTPAYYGVYIWKRTN